MCYPVIMPERQREHTLKGRPATIQDPPGAPPCADSLPGRTIRDMSKVIEFPSREKRIEKLLREQLPFEIPSDEIEKLATDLRKAAARIDARPKSFTLLFPDVYSPQEMEFVTRQVEAIIGELMNIIKDEEGEIFNLIIRYHLLLHSARRMAD